MLKYFDVIISKFCEYFLIFELLTPRPFDNPVLGLTNVHEGDRIQNLQSLLQCADIILLTFSLPLRHQFPNWISF